MKFTGLVLSLACLASTAFAHENGTVKIYDAKLNPEIFVLIKPGRLVLVDGEKQTLLVPKDAQAASDNLIKVRNFFFDKFSRKSWDNKSSDIVASVNVNKLMSPLDITGQRQNAAWTKTKFLFGAGSKKGLSGMVNAIDVVGHEYTHAVIQTSSNLAYEGQSGALNEHLADVFGAILNVHYNNPANPYLIGSSVLHGEYAEKAGALRDMMDPSKGLQPQPAHMDDLNLPKFVKYGPGCVPTAQNDKCGVHVLSGIPNRMAALVMSAIGPENAAPLFYNVMTKRLSEKSNFSDYRRALLEECQSMSSDTCGIVEDALNSVGIPAFTLNQDLKPLTSHN